MKVATWILCFRDPDGVASGDYTVNFHSYEEGIWKIDGSFTVRTDDNTADILLTWRGLYVLTPYDDEEDRQRYNEYRSATNQLVKHMKLIDKSNGNGDSSNSQWSSTNLQLQYGGRD